MPGVALVKCAQFRFLRWRRRRLRCKLRRLKPGHNEPVNLILHFGCAIKPRCFCAGQQDLESNQLVEQFPALFLRPERARTAAGHFRFKSGQRDAPFADLGKYNGAICRLFRA